MAGGNQQDLVDFPPLPSFYQQETNEHQNSSQHRTKNLTAEKPFQSSSLASQIHNPLKLVVGSIIIPPVSIPKTNRVEPQISKLPPHILKTSPEVVLQEGDFNGDLQVHGSTSRSKIVVGSDSAAHVSSKIGKESNLALCFKGSFPCMPIHKIVDTPFVSFDAKDKNRLLSYMGHIVIVKFTHHRPKFTDFKSFLHKLNFQGAYKIIEFDYKHIFIDFIVFEDCIKLLILKSIVIGGFRGRLFMWDADFKPSLESPFAPIWIHLPRFPLYLFDEKAMLSVASLFGKPVHIDLGCLGHEKIGVMSFCVLKDVRLQGPSEFIVEFIGDGIMVDRFTQAVLYGTIPDYCSYCLHMGHMMDDCKVMKAAGSSEKDKGLESNAQGHGTLVSMPSVFNRLQLDLKAGVGRQLVEVALKTKEQVSDRLDAAIQVQEGSSLQGNIPSLNCNSDRPSSGIQISAPTSDGHTSRAGTSNTSYKVDVRTGKDVDSVGKESVMEGGKTVEALLDSSSAPPLELNFSHPGASNQGTLVSSSSIIYKVDDRGKEALVIAGTDQDFSGENAADDSQTAGLLNSDSSVAPSLKSHFAAPGAEVHRVLAGNDSMISKVDISTNIRLDTAGEVHGSMAGTSVDEPLVADQILSKALSITSPGSPSHGSLEGTSGQVLKWLGKQVGKLIQDNLPQQSDDQEKTVATPKVIIKHPITKEIIHLSPKATSTGPTAPKSLVGLSKNAKKKLKKKQKKLDLQNTSTSTGILLDSDKSKADSQEQKSLSSQVSSDSSDLDLQQLQKAYKDASDSIEAIPLERSQSHPAATKEVEVQVTKEIESQEQLDHLPLLEAYRKGHFDVQVTHSKKYTTKEVAPRKAAHSSSLGVKVTVKTKVKEAEDSIAKATDDKVPKELFFFPPKPFTPAGVPSKYGRKKFNKEFLKPP